MAVPRREYALPSAYEKSGNLQDDSSGGIHELCSEKEVDGCGKRRSHT